MRPPTNQHDMGRRVVIAVLAVAALAVGLHGAPAATTSSVSGLPDGGPPALYRPEPTLPAPAGWPASFGDAFTRTSGTGRAANGAIWWTDWLYDDHGAGGVPTSSYGVGLTPPSGTYAYPDGPAAMNGADIFRAAVAVDDTSTWWRVDWTTLIDARVPIAAWAIDVDHSTSTGASDVGVGTGVRAPGTDVVLVVSSRGAWLVDANTGVRRDAGQLVVDTSSRSFVVRVPRDALPLPGGGVSRVRLVPGSPTPPVPRSPRRRVVVARPSTT